MPNMAKKISVMPPEATLKRRSRKQAQVEHRVRACELPPAEQAEDGDGDGEGAERLPGSSSRASGPSMMP